MFNDMCDVWNCAIVGLNVGLGGEEEVASGVAASFWFAKVACVAVDCKYHGALVVVKTTSSCMAR